MSPFPEKCLNIREAEPTLYVCLTTSRGWSWTGVWGGGEAWHWGAGGKARHTEPPAEDTWADLPPPRVNI